MTAVFQFKGKDKKLGEYVLIAADSKVILDDKMSGVYKPLDEDAKKITSPKGSNFFYSTIGSDSSFFTKYLLSTLDKSKQSMDEIFGVYDKIYKSSESFGVCPPAFFGAVRNGNSLDTFVYGDEKRFIRDGDLITSGVGKQVLYDELKDLKRDFSFMEVLNNGYNAMKKASVENPYVGGFMDFYVMNKDNVFSSKKRMPLEAKKEFSL